MHTESTLPATFEQLGIEYKLHQHAAAFTVEDQAKVVGHLPRAPTKNLFLKDKKHDFFLITNAAGTHPVVSFAS